MDKLQSTTEDDIEKALEKEMDKMQSTTEDDIEKALEKEMDKMQTISKRPWKKRWTRCSQRRRQGRYRKGLGKRDGQDAVNDGGKDDIEKALEKEMDKMQSTTEDDSVTSETQLETLRPTEDDLETALDRELDGLSPKAAATHPQTELDEDPG
eukprot:s6430_g1.t2